MHQTHKNLEGTDYVCECCGRTGDSLSKPCPQAPMAVKRAVARIETIDAAFESAQSWGSWMAMVSNERKELVNMLNRDYGLHLEHKYKKTTILTAGNVAPPLDAFALPNAAPPEETPQKVAWRWANFVFGEVAPKDRLLRALRFMEEAAELTQAVGLTREDAHTMVDAVYARTPGVVKQEIGGVMLTLMVLGSTCGVDVAAASAEEQARVWSPHMIQKIRARQATKPQPTRSHHSDCQHVRSTGACDCRYNADGTLMCRRQQYYELWQNEVKKGP